MIFDLGNNLFPFNHKLIRCLQCVERIWVWKVSSAPIGLVIRREELIDFLVVIREGRQRFERVAKKDILIPSNYTRPVNAIHQKSFNKLISYSRYCIFIPNQSQMM